MGRFASLLLVPSFFLDRAHGWWDQGHQLIAAIARMDLSEEEISYLDNALSYWAVEYPQFSNMVDAATWPDHTKCSKVALPNCSKMPYTDALEVFSDWHFHDSSYNPQNIALDVKSAAIPYPNTGAIWALETLVGYEEDDPLVKGIEDFWNNRTTRTNNHPNRHVEDAPGKKDATPWEDLSAVSWNLRLRFLIHIFGDIHQPLHASTTFSHQFPQGDAGGNMCTATYVGSNQQDKITFKETNLHAIWDAAGGLYPDSWPESTIDTIIPKAKDLVAKWPKSKFTDDERNKIKYADIVAESFEIAKTTIYAYHGFHFDNKDEPKPYGELPFQIGDEFQKIIQDTSEKRIALGGYRLVHHLKRMARLLKDANLPPYPININTSGAVKTAALSLSAILMFAVEM